MLRTLRQRVEEALFQQALSFLQIYLSYLSFSLSLFQSIYLSSIYLSIYLSIYPSIYIYIYYPSLSLSLYIYIYIYIGRAWRLVRVQARGYRFRGLVRVVTKRFSSGAPWGRVGVQARGPGKAFRHQDQ